MSTSREASFEGWPTPLASREATAEYSGWLGRAVHQGLTLMDVAYLDYAPSYVFRVNFEQASTGRQAPLVSHYTRAAADSLRDPSLAGSSQDDPISRPAWISKDLTDKLRIFLSLRSNWNRDGAPPVSTEAARSTLELALQISAPSGISPSIIPTRAGGIQLEWHKGLIDLEVEVAAQGDVFLWYDDEETGTERDERLPSLRTAAQEITALLAIVESRTT
jgi:hypothetical protein